MLQIASRDGGQQSTIPEQHATDKGQHDHSARNLISANIRCRLPQPQRITLKAVEHHGEGGALLNAVGEGADSLIGVEGEVVPATRGTVGADRHLLHRKV